MSEEYPGMILFLNVTSVQFQIQYSLPSADIWNPNVYNGYLLFTYG